MDKCKALLLGFVIDGFPATAAEAMALERALTGLDSARADLIRSRCSQVAPPALQELAAHADPDYVSGRGAYHRCSLSAQLEPCSC